MIDMTTTKDIDLLTENERKNFDLQYWKYLHANAMLDKMTTGWSKQAETGRRIKDNKFPVKPLDAAPDWEGKFYKDNWVWKSIKWLTSMLSGSEMIVEIKTPEGQLSPMLEPLENEVNFAADKFDITQRDDVIIMDKYYKGEGFMRLYWNGRRRDAFYQTGMPEFWPVAPEKICIDPATTDRYKSDMRYLFHEEYYDTATLRMRFPKYANQIIETANAINPNATHLTRLVTLQYKKTVRSQKIFITDTATGNISEFPLIELQEIIKDQLQNPDALAEYKRQIENGQTTSEFQNWILYEWILPENCQLSDPVETEEDTVWQVLYYPEGDLVLEPPTYVWYDFTYINLPGFKIDNTSMCYGLCYYLADMLEISVALMTTLTIQAIKQYIVKEEIVQGALINQEQYEKEGYKIGVNPIVDPAWAKQNPGRRAVEPIPLPQYPQVLLTLNDMIKNVQQTTTGVIDVVLGQQEYSGQPGIAIAQLQQASRVYFKDDILDYQKFNQKKVQWLMDMICRYRNYPHRIMGLNEDNEEAMIDVATNVLNKLESKYAAVHVTILENYEVVKAMEQQNVMALYQLGLVSGEYVLEKTGVVAPKREYLRAKEESGEKQIVDAVNSNPNLRQIVQMVLQTGKDVQIPEQQPITEQVK